MFGFSLIKHLPKKPLLSLAVVAVAASAALGGATRPAAAATTPFTIEVSFESVTFSHINDGLGNHDAELYGTLSVQGPGSTGTQRRMLGSELNPGVCGTSWTGSGGECYKTVNENITNFFSQTRLCAEGVNYQCVAPYATGNNKLRFTFWADPAAHTPIGFTAYAQLRDYDRSSHDDYMCFAGGGPDLLSNDLPTLDKTITLAQDSSRSQDGVCSVVVRFHRVA
jgi:hypothetical protein